MKSITQTIITATAALIAMISIAPEGRATNITLDGSGFYELGYYVKYSGVGKNQSGRYSNLGADYYHEATIGMRWITNHSPYKSGSLSFELWGMPYYGATRGIVLMTRSLDPLSGNHYYTNKSRSGWAISLDAYRFPELDLWEYTSKGWKWRDVLTFKYKTLL